ncbi:unnamed protein product [Echinostoma caproni]|uniref:PIK helical domain-containing protein n=1 Tax=Echinostoma caproni TaxID=27848 RepID=A0A3P8I1S5_9TREM|nr:unnamed protein product [Echinostoma caproni]
MDSSVDRDTSTPDSVATSTEEKTPISHGKLSLTMDNGQTVLDEIPNKTVVPRSPLLFRLFESSLFNMDMAIQYFFQTEEEHIQAYLAKRLFGFPTSDVDFYLLQLVSLYQKSNELAKHIHPYFIHRCTESTEFAIHLVWLLDTFCSLPRDAGNRSSTLNRPSSVPAFSHAASNLSLATLVQTTSSTVSGPNYVHGSDNPNGLNSPVDGLTPSEVALLSNQIFTARQLRTILLPSPEESLLFLAYHSKAPSENSSCSTTQPANPCNPTPERSADPILLKSSVEAFGPGRVTQIDVKSHTPMEIPSAASYLLSHKRAVSDVTNFGRFHPRVSRSDPCRTNLNGSLRRSQDEQWSSEDSAVGLSREGEIFPEDAITDLRLNHTRSSVRESFDSSGSHRSCDASDQHLSGLVKAGSSTNLHKITVKESTVCTQFHTRLRGTRSLQRLTTHEMPGSARPQSFVMTRNGSLDNLSHDHPVPDGEAPDSSGITTTTTTTTSSSPLDSGLHLVISTEHSHNSTAEETQSTGAGTVSATSIDHPALTLQLRLFPRLMPEWEFIDGLSRLARRLVPISSKERRILVGAALHGTHYYHPDCMVTAVSVQYHTFLLFVQSDPPRRPPSSYSLLLLSLCCSLMTTSAW